MSTTKPTPAKPAAVAPAALTLSDLEVTARRAADAAADATLAADRAESAKADLNFLRQKLAERLCADLGMSPGNVVLLTDEEALLLNKKADAQRVTPDACLRALIKS